MAPIQLPQPHKSIHITQTGQQKTRWGRQGAQQGWSVGKGHLFFIFPYFARATTCTHILGCRAGMLQHCQGAVTHPSHPSGWPKHHPQLNATSPALLLHLPALCSFMPLPLLTISPAWIKPPPLHPVPTPAPRFVTSASPGGSRHPLSRTSPYALASPRPLLHSDSVIMGM